MKRSTDRPRPNVTTTSKQPSEPRANNSPPEHYRQKTQLAPPPPWPPHCKGPEKQLRRAKWAKTHLIKWLGKDSTYASYVVDPLDVDVDGDTSPDAIVDPTFVSSIGKGKGPRWIVGASAIRSSCGGDIPCMAGGGGRTAAIFAVNSDVDGRRGRFFSKPEDWSRESTAKARKSAVLLLTLSVQRYSERRVR